MRFGTSQHIIGNVANKLNYLNKSKLHTLQSNSLENDLREELIYQYAANDGAVIIHHIPDRRLVAEKNRCNIKSYRKSI